MCRKFILVSNLERIESRFHVSLSSYARLLEASYCVSGGETSYVITMEKPNELQAFQLGMTPYWAKVKMDLINARAEGDKNPNNDLNYQGPNQIFLKRAFMKPIQSQRCLVLADAYYEWSSSKKPYLVYLQGKERPFAMAGLYDYWQHPQTKEILASFSIITTTANRLLQSIGVKRMPVILKPGYEMDWIKTDRPLAKILRLLEEFSAEKMNAYPVGDLVNTPGANEPAMINPIGERLQKEAEPIRKINPFRHYTHKKKEPPSGSWGEMKKKENE